MTETEEKPADTGSDHDDDLIHVVCCQVRFCDGSTQAHELLPPGRYPDDCIVCDYLDDVAHPCRVCGSP